MPTLDAGPDHRAGRILGSPLGPAFGRPYGFPGRVRPPPLFDRFVSAEQLRVERFLVREALFLGIGVLGAAARLEGATALHGAVAARALFSSLQYDEVRASLGLSSFGSSLAAVTDVSLEYAARPLKDWPQVALGRLPTCRNRKWAGRLFAGAALLAEPTVSPLPGFLSSVRLSLTHLPDHHAVSIPDDFIQPTADAAAALLHTQCLPLGNV